METTAHLRLKQLALAYLRRRGCAAAATEVRSPLARYRLDAAGYADTPPVDEREPVLEYTATDRPPRMRHPKWQRPPCTIIIECKQSRSDFLRDDDEQVKLLRQRGRLESIRRSIEEHRVKAEEPDLRRSGMSLFPELDQWDFARSRHPSYRRVLRKLKRVNARLHGQTKFYLMDRYRLADELYIAAPRGLIRRGELPSGWGLLECPPGWLDAGIPFADQPEAPSLSVCLAAPSRPSRDDLRGRLLRNIAVAASAAAWGQS